ncbi:hypothetical protein EVA_07143, partial [gut metagenome]
FVQKARSTVSPYNGGETSRKMVTILEDFLFRPDFGSPKAFYDGH